MRWTPARQYVIHFGLSMAAYTVVILVATPLVAQLGESPLRIVVAVLPVIPLLVAFAVFLRYLYQMDELQRKIQFEAFGFSLGLTGIITITLGFLENAGLPRISMTWVFPMLIALWGIGNVLANRRYR